MLQHVKQLRFFIAAIVVGGLLFTGCTDNPSGINPVDTSVDVSYSEYENSSTSGANVKLTNVNTQKFYESTVNEDGKATFDDLPAGRYDISVIHTLTRDEVYELTGTYPDQEEVTFNGSLNDVAINPDTESPSVELTAGRLGDLVIKQVYYAGSDIIDGALFRDQFIEIYNNSNEDIDVSGLFVMGAYGVNSNGETDFVTEDGQFDWNLSIGMPSDIEANENYLYSRWLYQIPENEGKVLAPGESIVIAQTALNHKEPFTNREGETVSVNDPSLTVDLSNADYEVYLGNEISNPLSSDIDNPDVPNMKPIFIFGRDMILDPKGRDAFVIFRTDEDPSNFESYPDPQTREVTEETTFYPQIPTEWVVDAVESQPSPANQIPKKLQDRLDATYTYAPGGSYSSNSVIRIESKTVDGRSILKDTNNSEEDFTFLERAEPRVAAPQTANRPMIYKRSSQQKTDYLQNFESRWAPSYNR